jgi:hypothetical protein
METRTTISVYWAVREACLVSSLPQVPENLEAALGAGGSLRRARLGGAEEGAFV